MSEITSENIINKPIGRENKFISSRRNDMLKLVAMITMFIDHLGHMGIVNMVIDHLNGLGMHITYDYYTLFRTIGRIAFPIFAYQVALGYSKTSNLKKYMTRLFLFACIAHIPYVVFNRDFTIHPFHFNVIFMLLFGVFAIMAFEAMKKGFKKQGIVPKLMGFVWLAILLAIVIFPQVMDVVMGLKEAAVSQNPLFSIGSIEFNVVYDFAFSYGTYGILMVLLFHCFKGRPLLIIFSYIGLEFFGFYLTYVNLIYTNSLHWFGVQKSYLESGQFTEQYQFLLDYKGGLNKLNGLFFQMRSLLSLPFIVILERFFIKVKLNKFIGYWFYPLHIVLIIMIAVIMNLVLV
ncbi:MAG: hypothetical protein JXR88_11605 [Clostridia bacterium]|nr:hypothetical protein [Clostridia bacterium]